jgi:hypothetical protein
MKRDEDLWRDNQVFVNLHLIIRSYIPESFCFKVGGSTYQVKSPVKNADQDLHRATAHRQYVLGQEQPSRQGHISQQAAGKCQSGETQPNDCQILEVPAIGLIAKMGQQISFSVEVREQLTPG